MILEKVALKGQSLRKRWWSANYHSLWVSLCLLYFVYTSYEVSLHIASLAWGTLATAGDNSQTTSVQITHVFFTFVLFYTPNLCTTTQHEENMRNLYWCSLATVTNNQKRYRTIVYNLKIAVDFRKISYRLKFEIQGEIWNLEKFTWNLGNLNSNFKFRRSLGFVTDPSG